MVHGIGEHSARYVHVGEFFASRGYDVLAFDNQGFGQSGGRRGHIDSFATYIDNIETLIVERRSLDLPVVLYGHSLGGLMATAYLTEPDRPQPDLAVLSAPALAANVPRWQRIAAPILGRITPKLFVPTKDIPGLLSRDPAVEKAYKGDPFVVRGATSRLGLEILKAMERTSARLERLNVPTYVLHGENDALVPQWASRPLENIDGVTYRSWLGLLHECHNEPEKDQVLAEIADWVDQRC